MGTAVQFERLNAPARKPEPIQPYFSISELADRWRCSRGTVYNLIRNERVLDFAAAGHRGKKLVPREVVQKIEGRNMRVFR
jgi:Helix-turn-helix domain